jgi:hypothetical protein
VRDVSEESFNDMKLRHLNALDKALKEDRINPEHYKKGIETIDYIKAKLTKQEYMGFLKGNIIKYISRAKYKGAEWDDYRKALWYANALIEYGDEKEVKE